MTPVFNSSVQCNQSQVPVWFTTYWSEASLTWALFLYGSAFSEYCWSTTHWVWSVNVSDMWGSLPPTLSNTSHKNVVKCHHLYLFIVYLASISSRVQNYIISRSKKKMAGTPTIFMNIFRSVQLPVTVYHWYKRFTCLLENNATHWYQLIGFVQFQTTDACSCGVSYIS